MMRKKLILFIAINLLIAYIAYKCYFILPDGWKFPISFLSGYILMAIDTFALGNKVIRGKGGKNDIKKSTIDLQLEVVQKVQEIEKSNRNLAVISKIDSMTGLYLKSAVEKNIESRIENSPNVQFSILMFDIDKFKGINDTLGHQIGDKCIKTLASFAQASFRQGDILGRYGGDEFIIVLPGTNPSQAYMIADRFRQTIHNKTNPQYTISIGIATYPDNADSLASLIEAADKALYISKQNGRNQVTNYSISQGDS